MKRHSLLKLLLITIIVVAGGHPAQAAEFFLTPNGAGAQTGESWENAFAKNQMATTLNLRMVAGDTLFLGSGAYGTTTLSLTTSGTAAARKTVRGVDTGGGLPVFASGNWARSSPDSGLYSYISPGGSYWTIENLILREVRYAVRHTGDTTRVGLTFRNIQISQARHGFYLSNCDELIIENCGVRSYTKHGFRLDQGCDNVAFYGCVADLSEGDASWYNYAESIPFGFLVDSSGAANTNVRFEDCVASNHLRNGQGASSYWNGDGFVAESNTVGLVFRRCIALNNEDGGFDLKQAASSTTVLEDCVAVGNSRNFRFWDASVIMENCVGAFPRKRGSGSSNGNSAIWLEDAAVSISRLTAHAAGGTAIQEDRNGSATLTDSIISFTGSSGTFKAGSVTLSTGTVTYRPTEGTDPRYLNATAAWPGTGPDLNNQTWGMEKGWHSPAPAPAVAAQEMARTGGDFTLKIHTRVGYTYQLQRRPDFSTGAWANAGSPVPGTGEELPLVHPGGAQDPTAFYRVLITP